MHYVHVMYAVKAHEYLDDELFDLDFSERHPVLHLNDPCEIPAITVLLFNANLCITLNEATQAFDNVRVILH